MPVSVVESQKVARDRLGATVFPVFDEEARCIQYPAGVPVEAMEEQGVERGAVNVESANGPGLKTRVLTERGEKLLCRPLREGGGDGNRSRRPRKRLRRRRGDWWRRRRRDGEDGEGVKLGVFGPAEVLLVVRE